MSSTPLSDIPNEAVVSTYDRLATAYDLLVSPLQTGTRERALDCLDIDTGDRVLEVGCGPGHGVVALARRVGPGGRVVGLDAAPGMLVRARARVKKNALAGRVDLARGDARALPLPDGSVDVAFVEDTLELFSADDMTAVIAELRRVLADDGRLGVITMERADAEGDLFVRGYDWVFEHVPGYELVGCRPVYARRALEDGGFAVEHVEHHRRMFVWPVEVLVCRPVTD